MRKRGRRDAESGRRGDAARRTVFILLFLRVPASPRPRVPASLLPSAFTFRSSHLLRRLLSALVGQATRQSTGQGARATLRASTYHTRQKVRARALAAVRSSLQSPAPAAAPLPSGNAPAHRLPPKPHKACS